MDDRTLVLTDNEIDNVIRVSAEEIDNSTFDDIISQAQTGNGNNVVIKAVRLAYFVGMKKGLQGYREALLEMECEASSGVGSEVLPPMHEEDQ